MLRKKFTLIVLLWFFLCAVCPLPAGPTTKQTRIRELLNQPNHKKTLFSVHFYDLSDKKTVFAFNADRAQMPASNIKLITTAAAVDLLGSDFTYQTIYGLYDNNLAIIAAGDPLLGDPVLAQQTGGDIYHIFNQLLEQLRKNNITEISGDLIIDNFIFDDNRFHPSWPIRQANRWYAAEVSALCFNNNCLDIIFKPAQVGQPACYNITPDTRYVNIINKCKTTAKRKTAVGATRAHDTNNITLQGSCKKAITNPIFVTVDRPSGYHGFVLSEFLLRNGINIQGQLVIKKITQPNGSLPDNFSTLLTHTTPLETVLDQCNQRSLNLAAECLFKTIGFYHQSQVSVAEPQGSWQSGRAAVDAFLRKLDVPATQYTIDDGSGLSKKNSVSARAFTSVLRYMFKHHSGEFYRNSLATPKAGTLEKRNRFNGTDYQDRIFAKTGVIKGARALSGYCRTRAGHWLAFSILTNTPAASNTLIDKIVKEMID